MSADKARLLKTYASCLNNAIDLLTDAEVLLKKGSYPRAYALAFTAIEEIVKSQLVSREEFDSAFRDHRSKIKRSLWATYWAHGDFAELPEEAVLPSFPKRMASLYVDINYDLGPVEPAMSVTEHEASELIRTGWAGLEKIRRWEDMGVMIGTKGFMK
jgi:AbiV family abortive infection protein